MKTQRNYLTGKSLRISLFHVLLLTSIALNNGCYTDKKISPVAIEMVVVFKADVPIEKSSSILFEKEYIFHEGADGSKGKKYFNETGPKYIVQVPKDKVAVFNLEMKNIPQIYEIYQADWSVNKD